MLEVCGFMRSQYMFEPAMLNSLSSHGGGSHSYQLSAMHSACMMDDAGQEIDMCQVDCAIASSGDLLLVAESK